MQFSQTSMDEPNDTAFDRVAKWIISALVYTYTVLVMFVAVTVENQFVHQSHVCKVNANVNINANEKYELVSKFQGWNYHAFAVLCVVMLGCYVVYNLLANPKLTRKQQHDNLMYYTFWILSITVLAMLFVMYRVITLSNMNCVRRDMGAIQYLAQASGASGVAGNVGGLFSKCAGYTMNYLLGRRI